MKTTLIRASSRGSANHGWLNTHHTFSFANYYDPNRIHFGALRVINDDIIAGGEGFGTHPHDNMEIITIPLYGDLEHKDSMGHTEVIKSGEVQVMSAGSGSGSGTGEDSEEEEDSGDGSGSFSAPGEGTDYLKDVFGESDLASLATDNAELTTKINQKMADVKGIFNLGTLSVSGDISENQQEIKGASVDLSGRNIFEQLSIVAAAFYLCAIATAIYIVMGGRK